MPSPGGAARDALKLHTSKKLILLLFMYRMLRKRENVRDWNASGLAGRAGSPYLYNEVFDLKPTSGSLLA
jgi:hypothetical protein